LSKPVRTLSAKNGSDSTIIFTYLGSFGSATANRINSFVKMHKFRTLLAKNASKQQQH
jgi:hypothetical protein